MTYSKRLQFPDNYFQEETKCGFTISKTMKHAWAAQMEVLLRIIEICERHGLTYYALWGTLLGAVRHEGFIPWDDDIDISFKREEYERFLQVAEKELPSGYCVLNAHTQEEWPHFHTRVTNSQKIDVSEERLSQFHGCPFVVGVDIFPLDYIPRDEKGAELQKALLGVIRDVLPLAEYLKSAKDISEAEHRESMETLGEGISVLEECCKVSIDRNGNVENQLLRLYDRICMMYGAKDGDILTSYPEYIMGEGFFLQKEWFGTKQMTFEAMKITVPSGYEQILTALYGDYMKPVRSEEGHEYPFYKEQLKMLCERGLWRET